MLYNTCIPYRAARSPDGWRVAYTEITHIFISEFQFQIGGGGGGRETALRRQQERRQEIAIERREREVAEFVKLYTTNIGINFHASLLLLTYVRVRFNITVS